MCDMVVMSVTGKVVLALSCLKVSMHSSVSVHCV